MNDSSFYINLVKILNCLIRRKMRMALTREDLGLVNDEGQPASFWSILRRSTNPYIIINQTYINEEKTLRIDQLPVPAQNSPSFAGPLTRSE